ncbi:hypothetical protein CLTEP_24940 [Clostridium tepidiprofundi DSM 19306]|uniref:Recombinase n=1 Tax=Clostridium tepidiprofundi DSM 19306 TaxID=1121338 RepID=A0A151AT55_9CLOT|nr:hypothetical protein CLTEP_24940 [Clostridium tepidiprofundi DSM 19306]
MLSNEKYKGDALLQKTYTVDFLTKKRALNTFNSVLENKAYFMEKWKEGLKSDNVLVRYKSKQFIEILKK